MKPRLLFIFPAVMMALALAPMPYGYYQLLRLVTLVAASLITHGFWTQGREGWAITFGLLALLFNPIFPLHLTREIWSVLNVGAAGLFMLGLRMASSISASRCDIASR